MPRTTLALGVLETLASCLPEPSATPADAAPVSAATADADEPPPAPACREGDPLTVAFYDAGQALAALVTLPDGRRILVDAGESPTRAGCGDACRLWHASVLEGLRADLGTDSIDMLWITHQHSDHLGGVEGVAQAFAIATYVDNGQDAGKNEVKKARKAATEAGAALHVVEPGSTTVPLAGDDRVTLTAVVPAAWPAGCDDHPNECSIGLRIDYCRSSILFTGDAELKAEKAWPVDDVGLLQVGHHGSDTSTSAAFVAAAKPEYAVVSCADRGDGTNRTYCHPRKSTIERLTTALGGPGARTIEAFDAEVKCRDGTTANWDETPTSDRLWITARDGTVRLSTTGDGSFRPAG